VRIPGIILEDLPKLRDGPIQYMIGDHRALPHVGQQFLAVHELSRPFRQVDEDVHDLRFDVNLRISSPETKKPRFDQVIADIKACGGGFHPDSGRRGGRESRPVMLQ
jgi:hypothetical protein